MRQGQQNRRGRGRNRKSQNPLTRSFESNGPDVKIRGTPAHIAEKYISLARDAQSSGDPVLAESYLQHAEHYNRIIMAFREQQIQQGGDPGPMRRQPGFNDFDSDDAGEDGDDELAADAGGGVMSPNEPQPNIRAFEPQQRQERQEGGRGRGDFQNRQEGRQSGRDRHGGGRSGNDRRQQGGDGDQPRRESRADRDNNRPDRDGNRAEQERPDQGSRRGGAGSRGNAGGESRRRDFAGGDQPEFLRRSVRRPRRARDDDGGEAAQPAAAEDSAE
jgi:hypothetical protein